MRHPHEPLFQIRHRVQQSLNLELQRQHELLDSYDHPPKVLTHSDHFQPG